MRRLGVRVPSPALCLPAPRLPRSSSVSPPGGVPERSKGADCKSAGEAYGGSNPPPSTISLLRSDLSGNSSVVERQPSKLRVAGSNPVSRSIHRLAAARPPRGGHRGAPPQPPSFLQFEVDTLARGFLDYDARIFTRRLSLRG